MQAAVGSAETKEETVIVILYPLIAAVITALSVVALAHLETLSVEASDRIVVALAFVLAVGAFAIGRPELGVSIASGLISTAATRTVIRILSERQMRQMRDRLLAGDFPSVPGSPIAFPPDISQGPRNPLDDVKTTHGPFLPVLYVEASERYYYAARDLAVATAASMEALALGAPDAELSARQEAAERAVGEALSDLADAAVPMNFPGPAR